MFVVNVGQDYAAYKQRFKWHGGMEYPENGYL